MADNTPAPEHVPTMMSPEEQAWYDACPKGVLYEIARMLSTHGMSYGDHKAGLDRLEAAWKHLHEINEVNVPPHIIPRVPVTPKPSMEEYWRAAAYKNPKAAATFLNNYGYPHTEQRPVKGKSAA